MLRTMSCLVYLNNYDMYTLTSFLIIKMYHIIHISLVLISQSCSVFLNHNTYFDHVSYVKYRLYSFHLILLILIVYCIMSWFLFLLITFISSILIYFFQFCFVILHCVVSVLSGHPYTSVLVVPDYGLYCIVLSLYFQDTHIHPYLLYQTMGYPSDLYPSPSMPNISLGRPPSTVSIHWFCGSFFTGGKGPKYWQKLLVLLFT